MSSCCLVAFANGRRAVLCFEICHACSILRKQLANSCLSDDDYGFTSEATHIVDALVSDDPEEEALMTPAEVVKQFGLSRTPSVPPGLGFTTHSHPPRTSTPSQAPPGFPSQPVPTAGPALPVTTPAPVTPSKPSFAHPAAPESSKGKIVAVSTPGSDAKKNIKALAVESGLSRDIASQAKTSVKGKKAVLKDEDFPALESAKAVSRTSTPAPTKAPSLKTPMAAKKTPAETPKTVATPLAPETPIEVSPAQKSKKAEKKVVPGALNIAAATKAAAAAKQSNPSSTVTSAVERPDDAAFPALPTPTSASVPSSAARAAPKTLRLVPTPKAETPPATSASMTAPASLRHAFSVLQRPETPGSENVSDSASIVSASVSASRTNSPPPTARVGAAAVRSTTKSQQRKARKDATKQQAAAIASQPKPEPEVVVAPIVSHKKKQKKGKSVAPKETTSKEAATVGESQPSSPGLVEKERDAKPAVEEKVSTYRQAVNESMSLEEPLVPRLRRKETSSATTSEVSKPVVDRASPSPAAVFRDLTKEGSIPDPEILALFKSVSSTSHRSDQYTPVLPKDGLAELKSIVSEEDQHTLNAGKPVHKVIDGSRVMLTPNGNLVRNLTKTEEQLYLQYQSSIAASTGDPGAYVHSRHDAGNGFSVIRGRAVANGTPSYFPQGPVTKTSSDTQLLLPTVENPMQKMSREEALANINQSILPRFNLGTMNLSLDGNKMSDPLDKSVPRGDAGVGVATIQQALEHEKQALEHEKQETVVKALIGSVMNGQSASQTRGLGSSLDVNGAEFSGLAQTMPPPPPMPSTATNTTVSPTKGLLSGHLSNITSMSLEEMEDAFARTKKEAEKIEKSLNQVIKKNRRILSMSSSGAAGAH